MPESRPVVCLKGAAHSTSCVRGALSVLRQYGSFLGDLATIRDPSEPELHAAAAIIRLCVRSFSPWQVLHVERRYANNGLLTKSLARLTDGQDWRAVWPAAVGGDLWEVVRSLPSDRTVSTARQEIRRVLRRAAEQLLIGRSLEKHAGFWSSVFPQLEEAESARYGLASQRGRMVRQRERVGHRAEDALIDGDNLSWRQMIGRTDQGHELEYSGDWTELADTADLLDRSGILMSDLDGLSRRYDMPPDDLGLFLYYHEAKAEDRAALAVDLGLEQEALRQQVSRIKRKVTKKARKLGQEPVTNRPRQTGICGQES